MLRLIKNSRINLNIKKNRIQITKSSKYNIITHIPKHSLSLLSLNKYKFDDTIYNYIGAGLLLSVILAINNTTKADNSKSVPPSLSSSSKDKSIVYRRKEIELHNTKEKQIWVTYKSGVYDITNFIANHPGGEEKLMLAAGKDLSTLWKLLPYKFHFQSPLAFELLEENRIGDIHPEYCYYFM
jgi:cytochrome b involved in lipid metabolism